MASRWQRSSLALFAILACAVPALAADAAKHGEKAGAEDVKFFEEQVKPILQANCIKCHGGEAKIKGGLRMTSRAELLKGGDTGAAVEPGNPDRSLLVKAIRYDDEELQMPPKAKLPQGQIDVLTQWVKRGAPMSPAADAPAVAAPGGHGAGGIPVTPEAKQFWSFQPVKRPEPPQVRKKEWVRN